jgi:hypothetical protein
MSMVKSFRDMRAQKLLRRFEVGSGLSSASPEYDEEEDSEGVMSMLASVCCIERDIRDEHLSRT